MMDLGLLIGEGGAGGEMALLLASTQDLRVHQALALQGKLLRKRIQTWSEQLGEEMRHKPVPVALERGIPAHQAQRQLPLPGAGGPPARPAGSP